MIYIMIMYDLSTNTKACKRQYLAFRKRIINHGFMMLTESIYVKALTNKSAKASLLKIISATLPNSGCIQWLELNKKTYESMKYLLGNESISIKLMKESYIEIGNHL